MKKFLVLCSFATFFLAVSGLSAAQKVEVDKGQSLELHSMSFRGTFTNASMSPSSGRLILNSQGGAVTLYDFSDRSMKEIADRQKNLNKTVVTFIISPSGQEIAYTSLQSIFSFSNGKGGVFFTVKRPQDAAYTEYIRFNNRADEIFTFAGSGSKDSCVISIWDLKTKTCRHLKDLKDESHCSSPLSAAFSPDDTKIATTSMGGTVKIWDVQTVEPLLTLSVGSPGDWAKSAEFDSSGTKIITASNDKHIKIWDVQTGECLTTIEGHEGPVNFAMFCTHEDLIISCSNDKSLKLWNASAHELYGTFNFDHPVKSACFMADGKTLVVQLMTSGTIKKEVCVVGVVNPLTQKFERFDKALLAALSLNQEKIKIVTSVID